MTDTSTPVSDVANRYATALFELAQEAGSIDAVVSDLDTLQGLFNESEDLVRVVRNPVFALDDRVKALEAVASKAGIGGLALNFIKLAAKNNRAFALPDMIRGYKALVAAHRGEMTAFVTSAEALSDAQQDALKAALKEKVGKDVALDSKVDPSLLGGLVVQVGSRMIDTSLRTKLNSLRIAMKEVG